MNRGIPDLTVYTFEAAEGKWLPYPDDELWSLDFREADSYAQKHHYKLIAHDLELPSDSIIEADYTEEG